MSEKKADSASVDQGVPPTRSPTRHESFFDKMVPVTRYRLDEYVICGVYFLFKKEKLTYIGQSINIIGRVGTHVSSGKEFDSFTFIRCARNELSPLEAACIHFYNPPENGRPGPQRGRPPLKRADIALEDALSEVESTPALETREEFADRLCISTASLIKLTKEGRIPVPELRFGKAIRYEREAILAALPGIVADIWKPGRGKKVRCLDTSPERE